MTTGSVSASQMQTVLQQALQPESVVVTDDTADHIGHVDTAAPPQARISPFRYGAAALTVCRMCSVIALCMMLCAI